MSNKKKSLIMSLTVQGNKNIRCASCRSEREIMDVRGTIVCNWSQSPFLCKSCVIWMLKTAAEQKYFEAIVQQKAPGTDVYALKTEDEVKAFIAKLAGTQRNQTPKAMVYSRLDATKQPPKQRQLYIDTSTEAYAEEEE